jgi:hypothetical protein
MDLDHAVDPARAFKMTSLRHTSFIYFSYVISISYDIELFFSGYKKPTQSLSSSANNSPRSSSLSQNHSNSKQTNMAYNPTGEPK